MLPEPDGLWLTDAAGDRYTPGSSGLGDTVLPRAGNGGAERTPVRRYHFAYDARSYHSLLSSITVEGRPQASDGSGVANARESGPG